MDSWTFAYALQLSSCETSWTTRETDSSQSSATSRTALSAALPASAFVLAGSRALAIWLMGSATARVLRRVAWPFGTNGLLPRKGCLEYGILRLTGGLADCSGGRGGLELALEASSSVGNEVGGWSSTEEVLEVVFPPKLLIISWLDAVSSSRSPSSLCVLEVMAARRIAAMPAPAL
mmetsp:Transcript_87190/g.154413  ORF Transcript_87190/g.154413 Transcript_87190/m.154413 type:complete len:177 (-) Transcript_87190:2339-2869(-)